jgi:NhaP-type Na+/H+ or K+/H+ antiporter
MQNAPVARWRITGFYVLFAALPVAVAAAAIAFAAEAPRWSFAAALGSAALGAFVGLAIVRIPSDTALPPWVFTAGITAACFLASSLHVSDAVAAVVLGFAAGVLGVASASLIERRKHHPESFRGQAS